MILFTLRSKICSILHDVSLVKYTSIDDSLIADDAILILDDECSQSKEYVIVVSCPAYFHYVGPFFAPTLHPFKLCCLSLLYAITSYTRTGFPLTCMTVCRLYYYIFT